MFTRTQIRTAVSALALLASTALAHNHVTVDTASGAAGDTIIVKAGYYPDETRYSIRAGRLLASNWPIVYPVVDQIPDAGPTFDWFAGDELKLTSDFFFASGHLAGGDFRWEIKSVVDIYNGSTGTLTWGEFLPSGVFVPAAVSSAPTRAGRSFDTHAGDHNHDQGYAFSATGVYEVTFVVWDANGRYKDSAPFKVRFSSGPVPRPF